MLREKNVKNLSVVRAKMRQWGIMRQLSCYLFQNQRVRESVKSILLQGNLKLYRQQEN